MHAYNLDAREFIRQVLRARLQEGPAAGRQRPVDHVVLNLPASAIDFLGIVQTAWCWSRWAYQHLVGALRVGTAPQTRSAASRRSLPG